MKKKEINEEMKSENIEMKEENNIQNEQNSEQQNSTDSELLIKIESLEKEAADLKDKLLRKAAEFENYKRRTENDQLNLIKYAAESFLIKLLPVVDDFERTLQHLENSKDVESLKKGVVLVYEKLMKILEEQGVKKIEAVGNPFDVNFHEALMQRKDDTVKPHTVIDEILGGYIYKDKVIRHSKVVVSEEAPEESSSDISGDSNKNSEEG